MKFIKRLPFVILALIPASLGILAMMNNLSQFNPTMHNVIIPMLTMTDVTNGYARAIRAIHNPILIYIAFCFVMTLELLVGIFASIGFVKMIKNLFKSQQLFNEAICWIEYACLLGIFVWGFVFFCIGGDYFLSWQNSRLNSLQSGSLMYVTLLAIIYFIFPSRRVIQKDNP